MPLKHNLLVLGSRNAKKEDQKLERPEVKPVQILYKDGELRPVDFFNSWGEVGVSAIAWHPDFTNELFVSVNDEIRRTDINSGEFVPLDLGTVGDIHDINFEDNRLWISSTEYDEALAYDIIQKKVTKRISLDAYRRTLDDIRDDEDYEKIKDRFHCNQVFRNYQGDLCVLIHSISGWQFYRVLFEMMVKKQGDGGVINLDKEEVVQLKLQSPHSVRLINGEYWIQDSSDLSTKIYDQNWKLTGSIDTGGFGRGVAFDESENIAYIGLSATRKRYLKIIPSSDYLSNRLLVTEINSRKKLEEIKIPQIEQMDNVYILDDAMLQRFERLIED